jgi:hypothetical protein
MLVCVPDASVLERDALVARIVCDATVGEISMPRKKSNLIKSILIAAFTASRRKEVSVPRRPRDSNSLNIQVHASVKKLFMGPALRSVRFLPRELELGVGRLSPKMIGGPDGPPRLIEEILADRRQSACRSAGGETGDTRLINNVGNWTPFDLR